MPPPPPPGGVLIRYTGTFQYWHGFAPIRNRYSTGSCTGYDFRQTQAGRGLYRCTGCAGGVDCEGGWSSR